jgi:1-acyl-sn-glycerol-3-phosphate acyltransferase
MSDSSIPNPQLYELVRVLASWYFTTFYDYTQLGLQNVPKCGPVIFAANHVSFYDPPAIGACIHRPINYFARDTLFKGLFGKALREIGTIPVARENADIKSLKAIFLSTQTQRHCRYLPRGHTVNGRPTYGAQGRCRYDRL